MHVVCTISTTTSLFLVILPLRKYEQPGFAATGELQPLVQEVVHASRYSRVAVVQAEPWSGLKPWKRTHTEGQEQFHFMVT